MEQHESQTDHAIATEPVNDDEVRQLLERLGSANLGGSENATVGAVAEATGTDPTTVGRLLSEIRKENFDERFGLQLSQHETRIESLEEQTDQLRSQRSDPAILPPRTADTVREATLDKIAEREIQRDSIRPIALVFALILAFIVICVMVMNSSRSDEFLPTASMQVGDGDLTANQKGEIWVRLKDGSKREPTAEERERAGILLLSLAKDK